MFCLTHWATSTWSPCVSNRWEWVKGVTNQVLSTSSKHKAMVDSTFAHWTTRSLYQFVSHRSEWVKDLTNQVSLTRESRSLFRPLGYQVIMHRVLHTLSGSKVWCLTNQVLLTSNYGRSVFRPLGNQVTCTVYFTLGVGQTQRSDELSCQGELNVSVTRSFPTVSVTVDIHELCFAYSTPTRSYYRCTCI